MVLASFGAGADVGGVQDGEGLFSLDGAAALVSVRHQFWPGAQGETYFIFGFCSLRLRAGWFHAASKWCRMYRP